MFVLCSYFFPMSKLLKYFISLFYILSLGIPPLTIPRSLSACSFLCFFQGLASSSNSAIFSKEFLFHCNKSKYKVCSSKKIMFSVTCGVLISSLSLAFSLQWNSTWLGWAVLETGMAIEKRPFHCVCFLASHFPKTWVFRVLPSGTCTSLLLSYVTINPPSFTLQTAFATGQTWLPHELNTLVSAQQAAFHLRDAISAVHKKNVVIESVLGVL